MIGAGSFNIFFSLLRSGMYGVAVPASEMPDSIDWQAIVSQARKQAVLGIIIDAIQYLPEPLRPSAPLSTKLGKFATGLIRTHIVLDKTVVRLVNFFREHGIDGILLKGQGVARYYREPRTRQCGDIDFYVGPSEYKRAVRLCLNHLIEDKNASREDEQHFVFFLDGVEVELHRLVSRIYTPSCNKRFQEWVAQQILHPSGRRTILLANTAVAVPSYTFDALYIFQHAWHHYLEGGVGLRQLCDWTMIFHSHSQDINSPELIANLRRFGLVTGWKLFACIAVNHLGVPQDNLPLYDPSFRKKSERILARILDEGNFGFHAEEKSRIFVSRHRLTDELQKIKIVLRNFFSLLPLVPAQAVNLCISTTTAGLLNALRRILRK